MQFKGYIEKLNTKTGVGKRGPWTLYSAQVNGDWVSCGFNPPPFKEGDYGTFDTVTKNVKGKDQHDLLPDSWKPGTPPKSEQPKGAGSTGRSLVQQQINWQSARNAGIELVKLLLSVEGLPLPAKAKRNEADVYAIVTAAVDKATVEYWNDTETLRKLETVQDAGALEEPPGAGEETDKDVD